MKKRPFGHRFYLTLLLSFGIAELWQWLFRSMAHGPMHNIVLAYVASDLTYWLWGGICAWYLGKILRAYVSKMIYRVFLVGAGALIIVIVYKAYGLYTLVTPEMHVRYVLMVNMALPLLIAFAPAAYIYRRQILSEDVLHRRLFHFGKGGSSIFAGVGTFRTMPAKLKQPLLSTPQTKDEGVTTDRIILGRTLPDADPFPRILGSGSKAHWILSGSTRSGKGVCYLLPLLMTALRDIIVFDPKGELAMNTLIRRSSPEWLRTHHGIEVSESEINKHFKYGRTYVFDPFGITPFRSSNYSIVSEIDPDSPDCGEYLTALMNGMVKPEAPKNKYFEEAPKSIIQAFIGHTLTWFKEDKHNLPFMVDLLYGKDPETGFLDPDVFENTLIDMLANDAFGGLIQQGARELRDCGPEQRGTLMTAISRAVKWISDPPMRAHLSGPSEFSFKDIGNTYEIDEHGVKHKVPITIFIVLRDTLMESHDRWIRALFSIAAVALQKRTPLPKLSTILLIDEFPKLSAMRTIVQGVSIFAGYKITLLLVIQDLPQLKKAYPAEWNTFFANSNAIWFGVNDLETATHISNMAGKNLKIRADNTPNIIDGKKVRNETATAVLTPSEIMALLSRGSRYQIVCSNDREYLLLLERLTFKRLRIIENGRLFRALPLDGLKGHYKEEDTNRAFQIIKTTAV